MIPSHRKPSHPGEILLHEFLEPMNLTQVELAKLMNVPVQRVNTIINGKRGVTAERAILLGQAFKPSPELWMNLQTTFDLYEAQEHIKRAA